MNFNGDFEKNMNQLVRLLKKILKNAPSKESLAQLPAFFKDSGFNLNLCFFTFIPMLPEELDEFEELAESAFFREEKRTEELSGELSADDLEFLRRHGIRF